MTASSYDLAGGLAHLDATLRAGGRNPADVTVVAVTKGHPIAAVEAALGASLADLGENYAEDLVAKAQHAARLGWKVRWHWLGRIQTNKLARLVPHVWLWQTLDSPEHAAALARRAPGARVLVQANLTGAQGRPGAPLSEVGDVVAAARTNGLDVLGLMGVGPAPLDPPLPGSGEATPRDHAASCAAFSDLVRVADALSLPVRSIGMTADLRAAAQAGTTMVRIGEALFGARPER